MNSQLRGMVSKALAEITEARGITPRPKHRTVGNGMKNPCGNSNRSGVLRALGNVNRFLYSTSYGYLTSANVSALFTYKGETNERSNRGTVQDV